MCYISATNEDIASKFTPVMQGNKWRIHKNQMTLKFQGQGQTHQKPWKSPLSHNFGTGSRRDFWLVAKCLLTIILIVRVVSVITYKVPFLRHVTSKQYIFVMFSSKHQGNNRSVSRSNIKVKGQGKRSRSNVKGQGHVFSVLQQYWSQIILYSLHTFHLSH